MTAFVIIGSLVAFAALVSITEPWWQSWGIAGKPVCTEYVCDAYQWKACTGGRCKYHCEVYCKCVPKGQAGEFVVIKGGRSA